MLRINANHPMARGLKGAWFFNESAGPVVYNAVSPVCPLTMNANASRTTTYFNRGVYSGGGAANGMYSGPIPASFQSQELSLFWFGRCDSIPATTDDPDIAAIRYDATDASPYACMGCCVTSATAQGITFYSNAAGVAKSQALTGRWQAQRFKSMAVTHTGSGGVICYWDGAAVTTLGAGAINFTATSYIGVGMAGQTIPGQTSAASNHVLLLYTRTLSPDEVLYLHRNPLCLLPRRAIYFGGVATAATSTGTAGLLTMRGQQAGFSARINDVATTGLLTMKGNPGNFVAYTPPGPPISDNYLLPATQGRLTLRGGEGGHKAMGWRRKRTPAGRWTRRV